MKELTDDEQEVSSTMTFFGLGLMGLILGGLSKDVRPELEEILEKGRQYRQSLKGGSDELKSRRATAAEVAQFFANHVNPDQIMDPKKIPKGPQVVQNIFQLQNEIRGGIEGGNKFTDGAWEIWSAAMNSEPVQNALEIAKQKTRDGLEVAKSAVDQVRGMSTAEMVEAVKTGAGVAVEKTTKAAQSIQKLVGDLNPTKSVTDIRNRISEEAQKLRKHSEAKMTETANKIAEGFAALIENDIEEGEVLDPPALSGGFTNVFTPSAGFMASLLFKGEFWTLLIASLRFIALRPTVRIDGKSQKLTLVLIVKQFAKLVYAHMKWNTLLAFLVSTMLPFPGGDFVTRAASKWLIVSAASKITDKMEKKHLQILSSLIVPGVLILTYYVNFHVAAAVGATFFVQTLLLLIFGHVKTTLKSIAYIGPTIGAVLSTIGVAKDQINSLVASLTE